MKKFMTTILSGVAVAALAQPALAANIADQDTLDSQQENQQEPTAEESREVPGENLVIVTADRREQTIQDYAGTVATVSGEEFLRRGGQNITDLQEQLSGVSIANNGGNVEIYIRGVGSSNNTELGDPAAAFHYDGVYVPRPSGIGSAFFDIERVEVNYGPQGTLRGRNATAGSVNAISWKPGIGVWDAMLEAEYGSYDQKVMRGMLNIPVGDNSAFRVSGMWLKHDSYYNNVGPVQGIDVAEAEDNISARVQFLTKPTDRLTVHIKGDYIHETGTGYTGTNYANPLGNGVDPDDIKDPRDVIARAFTPDADTKHWGVLLGVNYDFDGFTAEFTSSYRDMVYDYDAVTPVAPFYPGVIEGLAELPGTLEEELDNWSRFNSITNSRSWYNELRLFNSDGPFIWSVGGLYFREDQYSFLGSASDRGLFFQGAEFNMPDVDAESWAIYADATYEITDKFRVTGGIRYTDDQKSREGVAARYGFAIGGGSFECCGGARVGTEGFEFNGRDRTIFNPDINGDGTVTDQEAIDFYYDGVKNFGLRDNIDDIFANGPVEGHFDPVPGVAECLDTITGDGWSCDGFVPHNQFTYALPFQGQIFRQTGEMQDDFVDWRLRAEYDIADDHMVYALVANGHKSGGFNDNLGDAGIAPTYDTEKVRLYEIGSKNQFWLGDVRATLNGSFFYNDYDDQVFTSLLSVNQIVEFLGGVENVDIPEETNLALVVSYSYNAANSETYGIQLDGGFEFPHNINLNFNALWLEAKIRNADPIQDFRFQADVAPDEAVFQSIDGRRLPRTPRWQFNTSISQTIDVPSGSFDYVLSAGYRSSQYMTIFNSTDFQNPDNPRLRLVDKVGGYWTFDAGIGYTHGDEGKLRLEAYVNNFTDSVHEGAIIITQFDNTRFFTRPLTWGGRIRVKF